MSSWNESVKRILDFIPLFEREIERRESEQSKKKDCLCIRRLDSFRKTEAGQSARAIAEMQKSLSSLQSSIRDIAEYDDTSLKDKQNKLTGALAEAFDDISKIKESIPQPYDDSELIQKIESIEIPEPYDESKLVDKIELINRRFESFRKTESQQSARAIQELAIRIEKLEGTQNGKS